MFNIDLDEIDPMLKKKPIAKPCDSQSLRWICRLFVLICISILLLSVTIVAWNNYTNVLYEDDTETPTPIAMFNSCYNKTWNLDQINESQYKILFLEDSVNDGDLFISGDCLVTTSLPFVDIIPNKACCNFVIWNTI